MVDEDEDSGGKIDWTIAIVLSVAFHAAILGAVWMFSDRPGGAPADGGSGKDAPAEVARNPAPPADEPAPLTPSGEPAPPTASVDTPAPSGGGRADSASGEPRYGTYVVKSGDFLSRIANKCNCTVAELKSLNDIKDPNSIRPGQKLKVPAQE